MSKVIFTPWKTQSQLLAVRGQFYPPLSYEGPDMRSKACAMVESWKLRGNLPHPVEATALLTDAILHDDATKNSIFSIRATYSAAFCRFVTGFVDSKLYGQRKTMFQRAVDLGIPASFVELRHEATHRELPSLIVLRNAAQRSLEWLWDYFWVKVAADADATAATATTPAVEGGDGVSAVKSAVLGALEQLQGGGEGPPKKKRKVLDLQASVAAQLVSICKDSATGGAIVSKVLIEEDVLVPKDRKVGDSLNETFAKWDQFLQIVVTGNPALLISLTEEMVNELAFTKISDPKNNPFCEGIYMWLDHILKSAQWKNSRRLLSLGYIKTICNESQNHWTILLGKNLQDADLSSIPAASTKNKRETAKVNKTHTTDDLQQLRNYGWESLSIWDSRPLGVV